MANNAFGLIVVGDEILAGRRQDRHFAAIGELLRARGYRLAWLRILPDDPEYLAAQLQSSMAEGLPVFCCGGIGATPDDHTRTCAAKAAGVPVQRHPEALALIEQRFGEATYPHRARMADLPEGAALIPNPYNQIPGFSLARHYFLPGFPAMAHPMAEWVLQQFYPDLSPEMQRSVWVVGTTESVLMPLMESLTERFPEHKLFSLPRLGERARIEMGYRGGEAIEEPFAALQEALRAGGFQFHLEDPTEVAQ